MAITLSPSGLQYVEGTDAENAFPAIDQANKTILNTAVLWQSGTLVERPAVADVPPGSEYYATDTGQVFKSVGAAWVMVSAGTYTNLTLGSGIGAATGDYTPSARIESDYVMLRGSVQNTSGHSISASTTIFTLPSGMAPTAGIYISIVIGESGTYSLGLLASTHSTNMFLTVALPAGYVVALNSLSFSLI